MDGWLRLRLSAMMFGQYFILGAWAVPLPTYLLEPRPRGLGFTAPQTTFVFSTLALGGMIAPLFVGLLADRLFAAQRVKAVLHLAASGMLALAAQVCAEMHQNGSAQVAPLALCLLGFALCYYATVTLSNTIPLRHLSDAARQFGGVRLFGTLGWIAAGVSVGLLLDPFSPQPLWLSAAAELALGLFSLALPHTPPVGVARSLADLFGVRALGLFRNRSFAVFVVCALGITLVQAVYNNFVNRFLTELGVPYPTAVQTLAQTGEVVSMLLLPLALRGWGMKGVLAAGLAGWAVRYGAFATLAAPVAVAALPLHGFSFAFFYIAASLYVDRLAPPDLRASAQAIITFVTMGIGALVGNSLAGWVVGRLTHDGITDWATVWLLPGGLATAVTVAFIAYFHAPERGGNALQAPPRKG